MRLIVKLLVLCELAYLIVACDIIFGLKGNEEVKTDTVVTVVDTIKLPKTLDKNFGDFFNEFPYLNLPKTIIPQEESSKKSGKTITGDYLKPFVVGQGKLFDSLPSTAYAFFGRLNIQASFKAIILIQERKDGSYYFLCTLNEQNQLIEKQEFAFIKVGDGFLHTKNATIQKNLTITINERIERTSVSTSANDLQKIGIQKNTTTSTSKIKITPEGKFISQ